MHDYEAYLTDIDPTEEIDLLVVVNVGMVILFLTIIICSNIVLKCLMNRQETTIQYECCSLKTVTIGVMILFMCFMGLVFTILHRTKERTMHPMVYIYTVIPLTALMMYVVKEKDYTYPFIQAKINAMKRFSFQRTVTPSKALSSVYEENVTATSLNVRELGHWLPSSRKVSQPCVSVV